MCSNRIRCDSRLGLFWVSGDSTKTLPVLLDPSPFWTYMHETTAISMTCLKIKSSILKYQKAYLVGTSELECCCREVAGEIYCYIGSTYEDEACCYGDAEEISGEAVTGIRMLAKIAAVLPE
ncbi:hypothetical protein ACOSQ2_005537 [Xanthoceras sorbifolium]